MQLYTYNKHINYTQHTNKFLKFVDNAEKKMQWNHNFQGNS
jgi:hypothetical protein